MSALVTINGVTLRLAVRDACLNGMGVNGAAALDPGATCKVELRRDDAPDVEWIAANATVVRVDGDVAGIRFVDLIGVESLHHLRALIMYNAEDPDQMVAEFDAHWGLRRR